MATRRELLENWFRRVWGEQDEGAVDELFEGEGRAFGLSASPMVGPGDFKPFHRALRGLLTDFRVTVDDATESGDRIWAVCTLHAKTRDSAARPVAVRGLVIVRFADGKIVEAFNLWDFLAMFAATGQLPADAFERGLAGRPVCGPSDSAGA